MADNDHYDGPHGDDWDSRKVFVSRIPTAFDSDAVRRIFETRFGAGLVANVSIAGNRKGQDGGYRQEGNAGKKEGGDDVAAAETSNHRGFGFVTFVSPSVRDQAIEAGTVRGGAKETSKRKQTMYIRPLDRSSRDGGDNDGDEDRSSSKNICHLWSMNRCPYGTGCKFQHAGEGSCIDAKPNQDPLSKAERDKKEKCFSFKKRGKCAKGDSCPFSHDAGPTKEGDGADKRPKPASQKDCINWKKKGKCRKLNSEGGCPYRHADGVRDVALAKKTDRSAGSERKRGAEGNKVKQPLCVRVFGMNYDTKEEDIRSLFEHCGPIVEIAFPTFEDSGRSKGYCGVLFQSPKAVEKALLLHETELHGRWLSVQAGRMMLKQWEARERKSRDDKGAFDGKSSKSKRFALTESSEIGEFGQKIKKRKKHGYKD
jgi:RNA recognition motif-containing protein